MSKNFNEVLKEREKNEAKSEKVMSLDSTERIKVLSPGQMVFKRFITNRLAIVGTIILIVMFTFAFLIPIFYGYGQTEVFYKYDNSVVEYAQANQRTDFSTLYFEDAPELHYSVKNKLTAEINAMEGRGETESFLSDPEGNSFRIEKFEDNVYNLYQSDKDLICTVSGEAKIGTYMFVAKTVEYEKDVEEIEGFAEKVQKAIADKKTEFSVNGEKFTLKKSKKNYDIYKESTGAQFVTKNPGADFEAAFESLTSGSFDYNGAKYSVAMEDNVKSVYKLSGESKIALLTTYVVDSADDTVSYGDDFKFLAIDAYENGSDFEFNGAKYSVKENGEEIDVLDASGNTIASLSNFVIRRSNGNDDLEYAFKLKAREVIEGMEASKSHSEKFNWNIAQVDENGAYEYDENGNLIKEDCEVSVTDKNGTFVMTVSQVVYLIDTFAKPSKAHIVGTDGDGMDVFARMMYGGRVSLLVAFVVVILETILGVIMGGIAGFFGGWIDNLIMRMVDIFYCIPSMPILIILGALFDAMKMKPYTRLAWLMAVLGILGWASVARLVRGQILSLREQEFMVAAEAIGLRTKRRIFKHLVPNVMPQLIVSATSGLGSVILTESTLSFLGLGVKHPLATWGTMINSVSTAEAMRAYTYIWVPVGLLICLTVVAFNFVGDGLRDAFDPKMKR